MRAEFRNQLRDVQEQLAAVKADMVTSAQFTALESRVRSLESGGTATPELAFLRQTVSRLDPANRCLAFKGFATESAKRRQDAIGKFFGEKFPQVEIKSYDHVPTVIAGVRQLSKVSVVELSSRAVREQVLSEIRNGGYSLTDAAGASVRVDRAKTQSQLARNRALHKAREALKRAFPGKEVTIWCKRDGAKDRGITVGPAQAFVQRPMDTTGSFVDAFAHVTI